MSAHDGAESDSAGVSTVELFFDLVFVFTITQVTLVIDSRPDAVGIVQGILILAVLFWMYGGYAWLTNAMGADGTPQRVIILAGMAALFVCSQAVPHAFGDDGIGLDPVGWCGRIVRFVPPRLSPPPAVYLAATGLFRWVLQVGPAWPRATGAGASVATILAGLYWGTAQQLATVAVVVAVSILLGQRAARVNQGYG